MRLIPTQPVHPRSAKWFGGMCTDTTARAWQDEMASAQRLVARTQMASLVRFRFLQQIFAEDHQPVALPAWQTRGPTSSRSEAA